MTASPSLSDLYDEVPEDSPFDLYKPTTRQFTTGSFPIKTFQAQNGAEIRMLYGNQLTGKKMNLTYVNVTDSVAYHFMQHYIAMKGSYKTFQLDDQGRDGVFSGWKGENAGLQAWAWDMAWRYAEEPQVQSVFINRSTVTISLIAVPKP
jgi:hypothetical protein